jgi:hypothetical protein
VTFLAWFGALVILVFLFKELFESISYHAWVKGEQAAQQSEDE